MVENRAGAGGNLGAEMAVRSPADGYTLLLISASYTVNPSVYKLSFDSIQDITPIIQISGGPYVVAVHPSVPAKTLAEFVAYARQQPEKLAYGSSGNGSVMHVSTAYFLESAKIKVLHIPYKGTGPALQDTIGGQVQLVFGAVPTTLPHVRAGKLRAPGSDHREAHRRRARDSHHRRVRLSRLRGDELARPGRAQGSCRARSSSA